MKQKTVRVPFSKFAEWYTGGGSIYVQRSQIANDIEDALTGEDIAFAALDQLFKEYVTIRVVKCGKSGHYIHYIYSSYGLFTCLATGCYLNK